MNQLTGHCIGFISELHVDTVTDEVAAGKDPASVIAVGLVSKIRKLILHVTNCFLSGFVGESCEISSTNLFSSVRETFNNGWNSSLWSRINGGSVSSLCGNLDSGPALHFHEVNLSGMKNLNK